MFVSGHRAGLLLATSAIACATGARAGETVAYGYDSLGRLIRVERSGTVNNGVAAHYSYDPADNRTNVTVNGAPSQPLGSPLQAPDPDSAVTPGSLPSGGTETAPKAPPAGQPVAGSPQAGDLAGAGGMDR